MKKENGVTLIALVITIIVLLILAGISIAMLSGDNGILTNASKAGTETKIANAKENVAVALNTLTTDYYNKKYVENDTKLTSLGDYIDANVSTELDANLVEYNTTTKKFTLKVDTNITATYNVNNGVLGNWTNSAS